ncbi:hypothetical protein Zm00014a_021106 [Zea mays]|uniref:Uncharacterized protein n=1 Tax=Zea mays TaxID=4577 RepID=A0A3L6G4N0_MAIZE|nr:hypothetical protein Zm00014a_021106 [Zea mays]
MKCSLNMSI